MKRWSAVLCAAALFAVASSQAQASFRVLKATWSQCIIWDYGLSKPMGKDLKVVSKSKKSFAAALKTHGWLVKHKHCAW